VILLWRAALGAAISVRLRTLQIFLSAWYLGVLEPVARHWFAKQRCDNVRKA
jgi:hypothetical protein